MPQKKKPPHPPLLCRAPYTNRRPGFPPCFCYIRGLPNVLFPIVIFLSAFLLFLVQPLMGRFALPWFGGGSAVWTACMLFFQTMLLAGYAYAHWLGSRKSAKTQSVIHVVLLAVSLYSMELAEQLAEVEPFKTTFLVGVWNRSWPFWLFIGAILGASFFSERPYCKYICPLGAGLAISLYQYQRASAEATRANQATDYLADLFRKADPEFDQRATDIKDVLNQAVSP